MDENVEDVNDTLMDEDIVEEDEETVEEDLADDKTDYSQYLVDQSIPYKLTEDFKNTSPCAFSFEDEKYLETDEYALKKAREENILFASTSKNYTIIRPYITYSENRLQLGDLELGSWLTRALDGRTIVFSEDIASHTNTLTYGYDVAKGIAAVIGSQEALGGTFHITAKEYSLEKYC